MTLQKKILKTAWENFESNLLVAVWNGILWIRLHCVKNFRIRENADQRKLGILITFHKALVKQSQSFLWQRFSVLQLHVLILKLLFSSADKCKFHSSSNQNTCWFSKAEHEKYKQTTWPRKRVTEKNIRIKKVRSFGRNVFYKNRGLIFL